MDKLAEVESLERKILAKEDKIARTEERIENEERTILKREIKTQTLLGTFGFLKGRIGRSQFFSRFKKHKIIYSFVTLISVIMIWTGVQVFLSGIPGITNPLVSIPLGLLIVWIIDKELV